MKPSADIVIALDLGGTNTVYSLVNRQGDVVYENSLPTGEYDCYKPLIQDINNDIKRFLKGKNYHLVAAGIGAPNGNYFKGTIEFAPNLHWPEKVEVQRLTEELTGVPAAVTNDANAAAYGEMTYGAARGMNDFVVVTLGTGLGSGIVTSGKMLYGHTGFGGELGHVVVEENGRFCGCGKNGCLETYVSATGIKNTMLELMATTQEPSLLRHEEHLSGKTIEQAALKGDFLALKAFEITGKHLGYALANYCTVFDPEAIFLFGGLSLAGDLIFEPAKRYMEEKLMKYHRGKIPLLPSALNDKNAAVLGAAALAWEIVKPV